MNPDTHPTPVNIRTIANKLKEMIPEARNGEVKMWSCDIYKETHICGTVACHAGLYELHYALQNNNTYFFDRNGNEGNYYKVLCRRLGDGHVTRINWKEGADRMARDLGFYNKTKLEKWAKENPKLWGNENGNSMFESNLAFGQLNDTLKLSEIISHWLKVADRIENINHQ